MTAPARRLPRYPLPVKHQEQADLLRQDLYKGRARIEQIFGKLKRFKRIAMRCEKTAQNYASFVALACSAILIKSVHRV